MNISAELGIRIRHYRKEKHITQEQLAEICGMHPTYIGQLERGEKNATLESVYRIAKGLNIPISKLLENMENLEDNIYDIPNSIYQQLIMLPQDKQQDIQDILQKIINLI
ncbi:MAG: helix-turn-helix domain-containing protein [Lachnospiraceae bacterium]|nr:helix-turn-helix domain-containing protein [Lachnospiraceae bacterium]